MRSVKFTHPRDLTVPRSAGPIDRYGGRGDVSRDPRKRVTKRIEQMAPMASIAVLGRTQNQVWRLLDGVHRRTPKRFTTTVIPAGCIVRRVK